MSPRSSALAVCLAALAALGALLQPTPRTAPQTQPVREDAYRANNLGVALLEQFDFPGATEAFRRALSTDSTLSIARLNLGIALFYAGDADAAKKEIEVAGPNLGDRPQADYVLGLIARTADRTDEAAAAFTRVQKIDSLDVGTSINLGQIYLEQRKYKEAVEVFRSATRAEPYNATAAYGLATALIRSGSADEGRTEMERFQRLRESNYAVTFSRNYLEQGRYAEAISSTGAEPELVDERTPDVTFSDASSLLPAIARGTSAAATGSVTLVDLDNDGDPDLVDAANGRLRIYRNDAMRFTDVTATLLGAAAIAATASIGGDYDNDGRRDLLVLHSGGVTLLHQDATGRFADVTAPAGVGSIKGSPRAAAWLDADHDGDLDILLGDGPRLLRNNGDGRFTDITSTAKLAPSQPLLSVVPTDYDNRRDIDLLLVAAGANPSLYRNLRDGSFQDVAADVGLKADPASMVAVGDINKDGYIDVFLGRRDGPGTLLESDGKGRFTTQPAPPSSSGAIAGQLIDYDNDGLLDLVLLTAAGPKVVRSLGRRWIDVTERAVAARLAVDSVDAASLDTGDLDGDGDLDAVVRTRTGLALWRNDGGRSRSVRVQLSARVSNRSAVGAKIEVRAGSLRQRAETYSTTPAVAPADVVFGVGARSGADIVRVLWPSGILQAETSAARRPGEAFTGVVKVEELDRKPSSCPYLYTWNGERFEFVTDFLGGGEMGYWLAPGVRNTPQPEEYVRIDGSQLRPRDGRYEIRVTNELEEALFLDRLQLVAVAHPQDVSVYPNAGLREPPEPFRLYTIRDARPPITAVDDHGRDVLDLVSRVDRRYPDDFPSERIRGYAAEHTLTLTLPSSSDRRVLLMTGWTDYAFSGDNVAAHQSGLRMAPPSLQVRDSRGRWRTAIEDLGFPAGRPQTVTVDLTDRIPADSAVIRIVTTMKVYWDRILVAQPDERTTVETTRLEALAADLRWRGFSAEVSPDGREPFGYAYERVTSQSPWKLMPGRYTREGDVKALLARVDDLFVVSRPGDEVSLTFDAPALPPLRDGWTRTFLLYADGFSKEMDINSASPDQLEPLPFHGMKQYPSSRRLTDAYRTYVERFNTRIVTRPLPPIELSVPQH
jgi:tetratricopeptide (TPR) repeat protein